MDNIKSSKKLYLNDKVQNHYVEKTSPFKCLFNLVICENMSKKKTEKKSPGSVFILFN